MIKKKYELNFHQSFTVSMDYILKIMKLYFENALEYSKEEISELTGIPTGKSSGKVVPHIKYAKYFGLINYNVDKGKYKINITDLGNILLEEDPYLNEEISLLLINYLICSEEEGADMWYYISNILMPKYNGEITKKLLIKELELRYIKNKVININPWTMYYKSVFKKLRLYYFTDDNFLKKDIKIHKEYIYMYSYLFMKEWEKRYSVNEITINSIDKFNWKEKLFISRQDSYKILDYMSEEGIIQFNKQLTPVTIVKLKNSSYLLKKIYSKII